MQLFLLSRNLCRTL